MKKLLIILMYGRRIEGEKCYRRVSVLGIDSFGSGFWLVQNQICFILFHPLIFQGFPVLVRDDCTDE